MATLRNKTWEVCRFAHAHNLTDISFLENASTKEVFSTEEDHYLQGRWIGLWLNKDSKLLSAASVAVNKIIDSECRKLFLYECNER